MSVKYATQAVAHTQHQLELAGMERAASPSVSVLIFNTARFMWMFSLNESSAQKDLLVGE